METQGDDDTVPDTKEDLLCKIKSMRADLEKARNAKHQAERELRQSKKQRSNGGVAKSNKFDPNNPIQPLLYKTYQKLTKAQKDLIREARKKAGITPNRHVGSVSTVRVDEDDDITPTPAPAVPTAGVSPSLLQPNVKKISLTQCSATHSLKRKSDE